jgi:hypothetical protein
MDHCSSCFEESSELKHGLCPDCLEWLSSPVEAEQPYEGTDVEISYTYDG